MARVTKRENFSGASAASHPPSAVSQFGVVKWWKVTTGTMSRSRHAAQIRR